MKRSCQRQTQVFDLPIRRMILLVPTPSALKRRISARQTCLCGALRSRASTFRRRRSAGLRAMEIPVRMRQTRMHPVRWESLPGFKCQTQSTRVLYLCRLVGLGEQVRVSHSGRCSIRGAAIALLAMALSGCASRLGPEVLASVVALPGAKTLAIYVATTRERQSTSENVFTSNRANSLNFAKFVVSVPALHRPGNVELPTAPPDLQ